MLYMVTFTINIPQMLAYIPYMDPMGYDNDDPMIHEYRPTARCDTRLVERRGLRGRWGKVGCVSFTKLLG
jgi:hypothetical protein